MDNYRISSVSNVQNQNSKQIKYNQTEQANSLLAGNKSKEKKDISSKKGDLKSNQSPSKNGTKKMNFNLNVNMNGKE